MQTIRELLTRLGVIAAHPGAFGILIGYAVLWFIFDRDSFDWHAGCNVDRLVQRRTSRHSGIAGEDR